MKFLAFIIIGSVANLAFASQDSAPDILATINGDQIEKAGWSTSDRFTSTILNGKTNVSRFYSITYVGGEVDAHSPVRLNIDGVDYNDGISYGGGTIIQGRNIIIKQSPTAKKAIGLWSTIADGETGKLSVGWAVDSANTNSALLAKFDSAKDMLVEFANTPDINCQGAFMTLYVDGVQVDMKAGEQERRKYEFSHGSGVRVNGKLVTAYITSDCDKKLIYTGRISVVKSSVVEN